MAEPELKLSAGRKLFFGLFIFPLLIAVSMAVLLSAVVFLTHEKETPETLIASIKSGSPGKRWQKAFELSNELGQNRPANQNPAVMKEITHILRDSDHYDAKTRAYMAMALAHFQEPESTQALIKILSKAQENEEVQLYALWALGLQRAKSALPKILPFLKSDSAELRKIAAYVLGVVGENTSTALLQPLLSDPVADVRWNAALALARLGDASGSKILLGLLERNTFSDYSMDEEEVEKVMINAVKGLALLRNSEADGILKSVSQHDKNLKVRQAAMEAMRYQESGKS